MLDPSVPPSVAAERVAAERRGWLAGLPVRWEPSGNIDQEPWITLAVVGALWAGELTAIETAWSGTELRGGAGLVGAIAAWPAARAGKGGIWCGVGHDHAGVLIDPRRARADFWAGQVDAHKIWAGCVAAVASLGGEPEIEMPGAVRLKTQATGYYWQTVGDPDRFGFSPTTARVQMPRFPALELVMLLGAEWLIREGAWHWRHSRYDSDILGVALPAIGSLMLRDIADMRTAIRAGDPGIWYPVRTVGKRRYFT